MGFYPELGRVLPSHKARKMLQWPVSHAMVKSTPQMLSLQASVPDVSEMKALGFQGSDFEEPLPFSPSCLVVRVGLVVIS